MKPLSQLAYKDWWDDVLNHAKNHLLALGLIDEGEKVQQSQRSYINERVARSCSDNS